MNKIARFCYHKSTLMIVLLLTAVSFSYLFFVMMEAAKCFEVPNSTPASLGTSFGFSYEAVVQFFSMRSQEMIACYRQFNLVWDSIFAILYGLMYVGWTSLLFKPFQERVKFLNLLPVLQVVFDWIENFTLAGIASASLAGAPISPSAVAFASFASMAKWLCSSLVFVAIIVAIALRLIAALKNKK